jgi:hypothetical protein
MSIYYARRIRGERMIKKIYLEKESKGIEPLMKSKEIAVIPYDGDYRIAFRSIFTIGGDY